MNEFTKAIDSLLKQYGYSGLVYRVKVNRPAGLAIEDVVQKSATGLGDGHIAVMMNELVDLPETSEPPTGPAFKVVVYRKSLLWRVKLTAKNGLTLMSSETYFSRSNAVRIATKLRAELGLS